MAHFDVAGKSYEALSTDPNLIQMGHNCNFLPLHPAIREALNEAIASDEFRSYAPVFGFERLRELVLADLAIPNTHALITHGSTDAIYQALSVMLEPGDEIIVTDPGWPQTPNFARGLGAKVIPIDIYNPECGYKLTIDRVRAALTERTKVITLIDPLNPMGSGYSEEEVRAFCRLADEYGLYVLHDATYRDFAGGNHFPAPAFTDRAVIGVSLSKSCGFAGLRVGAIVAGKALFDKMTERQVSRLGTSVVAQRGAIAAYEAKQEWLPRVLQANREHQAMLQEAVDAVPGLATLVSPSQGNFLAVDVTQTGRTAEEMVRAVLAQGIVVRSGAYTSQRLGDRFMRITTTVPKDNVAKLCAALPEASKAAAA